MPFELQTMTHKSKFFECLPGSKLGDFGRLTCFFVNFHKTVLVSYGTAVSVAECCALKQLLVLLVTLLRKKNFDCRVITTSCFVATIQKQKQKFARTD